jgi:ferredoxin
MRALEDGRLDPTPEVIRHLDLCLGCRACETACPSGVEYGALIEAARPFVNRHRPAPARVVPRAARSSRRRRSVAALALRLLGGQPWLARLGTAPRAPPWPRSPPRAEAAARRCRGDRAQDAARLLFTRRAPPSSSTHRAAARRRATLRLMRAALLRRSRPIGVATSPRLARRRSRSSPLRARNRVVTAVAGLRRLLRWYDHPGRPRGGRTACDATELQPSSAARRRAPRARNHGACLARPGRARRPALLARSGVRLVSSRSGRLRGSASANLTGRAMARRRGRSIASAGAGGRWPPSRAPAIQPASSARLPTVAEHPLDLLAAAHLPG